MGSWFLRASAGSEEGNVGRGSRPVGGRGATMLDVAGDGRLFVDVAVQAVLQERL